VGRNVNAPEPVRLVVADAAVARIAAISAARVPGVVALRADLGQALLGIATAALGSRGPAEGATAAVDGAHADVSVTVVTRLGHNCLDVVQAVQRAVATDVTAITGLSAQVRVTIADIALDQPHSERIVSRPPG
jgi:uncharacterized alkaline shock family protein YloU